VLVEDEHQADLTWRSVIRDEVRSDLKKRVDLRDRKQRNPVDETTMFDIGVKRPPEPEESGSTKNGQPRSTNPAEALRAVSLVRHYRMGKNTIPAVDGVSMAADRGEFICLLGTSGSGKSTLLNLFAGLDRPQSGAIVVDGHDLATMDPEQLAQYRRHTIGMVFQSFNLVPTMTLYENVELPMRFAEVRRRERRSRVTEALERVGLSDRDKHRPSELSGGEQQRAALARALVNQPKILLADEPTGNLDSKTGTEIMDLISELNKSLTMTVIMVTHERALADRCSDRMIFLGDGKVLGETKNSSKKGARA
jgi:putative ABC transport system ATP-binding protein